MNWLRHSFRVRVKCRAIAFELSWRANFSGCSKDSIEAQLWEGHDFTGCGKTRSGGRPGIYPWYKINRINAGFSPEACFSPHWPRTGVFPQPVQSCRKRSKKERSGFSPATFQAPCGLFLTLSRIASGFSSKSKRKLVQMRLPWVEWQDSIFDLLGIPGSGQAFTRTYRTADRPRSSAAPNPICVGYFLRVVPD